MLMNNLDPDVAEAPRAGGLWRASAVRRVIGHASTASVAALRDLDARRNVAGAVGQAGGACPHPRRCAARADRATPTSCRTGRPWSISTSSSAEGLMMFGQMTAGSWI